jgi:hypothetical protein
LSYSIWLTWLLKHYRIPESQAMVYLSQAVNFALPSRQNDLKKLGVSDAAIKNELMRARTSCIKHLYAGVELVEIPGIAQHTDEQITTDLNAFRSIDIEGLVLSWDLWHIPEERLKLIHSLWFA